MKNLDNYQILPKSITKYYQTQVKPSQTLKSKSKQSEKRLNIVVLPHKDSILQRIYKEMWYLHTYTLNLTA